MIKAKEHSATAEILSDKQEIIRLQDELAKLKTAASEERQRYYDILSKEIAKRQRAEKEVKLALSLLHKTFDISADAIIFIQNDRHIVNFNQNFVEMWAIPPEVIASLDLNLVLPLMKNNLKDQSVFEKQVNHLFSQSYADKYGIFELSDGRIFECYVKPYQICETTGIVCRFRDMTIVLELGESEERYKQEKELSKLKELFFSMASHDFRTPLTTIFSSCELLKNYSHKFSDDKKYEYLLKIQCQVNNMLTLLDDVLFISKAEAGRMELNPAFINLEEFCREVLSEAEIADGENHSFDFECQGDCSLFKIDKKLLRKILTNLLSNAAKYSPSGSFIQFNLVCEEMQITLKVKDSGMGIPESDRENLFEAFYRASNVSNIDGTGLGLSIIKQAVELHGGTISLDSKEGLGTTFTISIPTTQLKD